MHPRREEIGTLVFTAARLLLLPPLALAITRSWIWTLVFVASVVVWDELDGRLARRLGTETPLRRLVDSGCDRLLVNGAFLVLVVDRPAFALVWLPMLLRDVAYARAGLGPLREGVLVLGRIDYKVASVMAALLGVACVSGVAALYVPIAMATLFAYFLTQRDFSRQCRWLAADLPSAEMVRIPGSVFGEFWTKTRRRTATAMPGRVSSR